MQMFQIMAVHIDFWHAKNIDVLLVLQENLDDAGCFSLRFYILIMINLRTLVFDNPIFWFLAVSFDFEAA